MNSNAAGGGIALKEAPAENTSTHEEDTPKDPLGFLPFDGAAKQAANWIAVALGVWLLLNGVGMIGDSTLR